MKLRSVVFDFTTHEVKWKPIGKSEISGRTYPMVYEVVVSPGEHRFRTSMNANKSNSIDLIKSHKTFDKPKSAL